MNINIPKLKISDLSVTLAKHPTISGALYYSLIPKISVSLFFQSLAKPKSINIIFSKF